MLRLCLLLSFGLVAAGGCSWLPTKQKTRYVTPKLSTSMTCSELVDHLNRQCHGLHAWRCMDTTLYVRMPNGIPARLSGHLACEAPSRFRLTASSLVANTDIGANAERCWFYSRPGAGQLLTWQHQDAELLQNVDLGVPRMEPAWLMEVLGVMPLNAADFAISTGPAGGQELWLTAVSDNPDGSSVRRVIKVDTVSGLIREHAIYDQDRTLLVRASVSGHKSVGGHLLPREVALDFPQMQTQLTLRFGPVETNCRLPENLWMMPVNREVEVVDLGNHIRAELRRRGQAVPQSRPNEVAENEQPQIRLQGRITPQSGNVHLGDSNTLSLKQPDPYGFYELEQGGPATAELPREPEFPQNGGTGDFGAEWPAVAPFDDSPLASGHLELEPDWDLPPSRSF